MVPVRLAQLSPLPAQWTPLAKRVVVHRVQSIDHTPPWWKWQSRTAQNRVLARACRFDSGRWHEDRLDDVAVEGVCKRLMAFCDFCTCEICTKGLHGLTHALTEDGRWICDVCWRYDVCVRAKAKKSPPDYSGPCEDEHGRAVKCEHRPKLIGGFTR